MSQEPVRYWVPRAVLVGVDSLLRNQTDEIVVLASAADALARELEEAKARNQAKCGCNCHELCKVPDAQCEEHKTCAECFKAIVDENRAMEDQLADNIVAVEKRLAVSQAELAAEREKVKGLEADQKLLCGRAWQVERVAAILEDADNEYEPGDEVKEDSVCGEVWKWKQQLTTLTTENAELRERNAKLASEIMGLR